MPLVKHDTNILIPGSHLSTDEDRLSRGDAADIQSTEITRYDWTSCQAHESGPKETSGLSTR